ncbi:MAG: exonuclease domain-containing protein [Ruthenibacterium sp.]
MTELAVIDFETTGLSPAADEVLQVSILDENGAVLMNELCGPRRHTSWDSAQRVHGIAPERVAGLPPFETHCDAVREILSGAKRVVAYNAPFERSFLNAYGIDAQALHWAADPMETFAAYFGGVKRTLSVAAGFFGCELAAHDALLDVRATLLLLRGLESGGPLAYAMRDAAEVETDGIVYRAPTQQKLLRLLKALNLCPLTAAVQKPLLYKGMDTVRPAACEVLGFIDRSREQDWLVLVLRVQDRVLCVCDDYLREMQTPAFGRGEAGGLTAGGAVSGGAAASGHAGGTPASDAASGGKTPADKGTDRAGEQDGAAGGSVSGAAASGHAAGGRYAAFAQKSAAIKNLQVNTDADSANPLYGKSVVFTGDMTMPRDAAAQAVAALGASVKSGVSAKTDFLIVGAQDAALVGGAGRSGKEEKACALNAGGKAHIEILREQAFRAILLQAQGGA